MKTFDVAIVGAGIVGAACAAALSREGLSVVVIDKDGIANGTTAAGMGHIVVMDDSEAQFALTHYSQQLWDRLAEEMPLAGEFEHCGTIWVAADDEEMAEVERKQKFYAQRNVKAEILDEKSRQCLHYSGAGCRLNPSHLSPARMKFHFTREVIPFGFS